ncbi:MAG: hypothetical protein FWF88_10005 [Peptococcaceae bacterium]|nr:hypothetical protein [Peptococcaceae bacterium]
MGTSEGMTDLQFEVFVRLILELANSAESLEGLQAALRKVFSCFDK